MPYEADILCYTITTTVKIDWTLTMKERLGPAWLIIVLALLVNNCKVFSPAGAMGRAILTAVQNRGIERNNYITLCTTSYT